MFECLHIQGGGSLQGTIPIEGAKNAALPCMAVCLLTDAPIVLEGMPAVQDVWTMRRLLEDLGVQVNVRDGRWTLQALDFIRPTASPELTRQMRASFLVLGPLGVRCGVACVTYPGGCAIGERPVDMHLAGLVQLGFDVHQWGDVIEIRARQLRGAVFRFPRVTVTGTEHLMMTAAAIPDVTILENCAREPEVVQVAYLLNQMGAEVEGAGTSRLVIRGRRDLGGATLRIIPDRIEAGTYAIAAVLTRGRIHLRGACLTHLDALMDLLQAQGVRVNEETDGFVVDARSVDRIHPIRLMTAPYPGFPTDLQAQMMTLMTQAEGTSRLEETVFPDRFRHVGELQRMGARIDLQKPVALIQGPTPLRGATVQATDLRASAGLVLAGLVARGTTVVTHIYHLDRGYAQMEQKLKRLGASIERVSIKVEAVIF